jgi:hypothetical protein
MRIGKTLCLFFNQVVTTNTGLGFAGAGSWLLTVENPDGPPAQWRIEQVQIPFYHHGKMGDMYFGSGNVIEGEFVYVYGLRESWWRGPGGRDLLVARVPREALLRADFTAWRFYDGKGWSADVEQAAPLCNEVASELSVSWLPALKSYVCVYSRFGNSPEIHARFAPRPEGPWSAPRVLHTARDESWDKGSFYYAAKAHPELAGQDSELIITYATNNMDLGTVARDLRLYWPRFVRVTLKANDK